MTSWQQIGLYLYEYDENGYTGRYRHISYSTIYEDKRRIKGSEEKKIKS